MASCFRRVALRTVAVWCACLTTLASCQMNGNIGDLYGQWRLEAVSGPAAAVAEASQPGGEYTYCLSFQGQVAWLKRSSQQAHTFSDVFGRFEHRRDSLQIGFVDVNDVNPADRIAGQWFGFDRPADVRLHIDALDDRQLILSAGSNRWLFGRY